MTSPEPTTTRFYDCMNADTFRHTTVNDAVADYLCEVEPTRWPETLLVKCYEQQQITEAVVNAHALALLSSLVEDLDEEYAGGGDSGQRYHGGNLLAARRFVEHVVADYVVWRCDEAPAHHVTVRVVDRVRQTWSGEFDDELAAAVARLESL